MKEVSLWSWHEFSDSLITHPVAASKVYSSPQPKMHFYSDSITMYGLDQLNHARDQHIQFRKGGTEPVNFDFTCSLSSDKVFSCSAQ